MLWTVAVALGMALLLVAIPILKAQLVPSERRTLQGVQLCELEYQEVKFRNAEQDIKLAGMLFLPEGEGTFPAVVVIHGSGTSRRDNPWYLSFTKYLMDHGVAVLLPDKRGSEASGGDWRTSSLEDLATDTVAAVHYLRQVHAQKVSAIGVLGASQGGQIAPIVAARSPEVQFVIDVVGASVPIGEALLFEERNNLREFGLLPGLSDVLAHVTSFYIRTVAQRTFWDAIGNFDPVPFWRQITVPSLVLYGALDTNVPTRASVDRFAELDRRDIQVVVYEGSGHPLEDPIDRGDRIVRTDALEDIVRFIRQATCPTQL